MSTHDTMRAKDASGRALDLAETRRLRRTPVTPTGATLHTRPDTARREVRHVAWLYDYDYGWTPEKEAADPRPPLLLPPYYVESFPLRTRGLAKGERNTLLFDLRQFPRKARLFVLVPRSMLGRRRSKLNLLDLEIPQSTAEFNAIFGKKLKQPVGKQVLLEARAGARAILDGAALPANADVTIELYYAMLRADVRPKTYYVMHLHQLIDGRLMGSFDHVFQSYHPYDIPVVGDRRTRVAHRRSAGEVASILPLDLAFFDSWTAALVAGYAPAPRSYGRRITPDLVPDWVAEKILGYFNGKTLTAEKLVKRIGDNPYVSWRGASEPQPTHKVGLTAATARDLLARRAQLGGQFSSLREIDQVPGVGPDTLNDILATFIDAAAMAPPPKKPRLPDPRIVQLLGV